MTEFSYLVLQTFLCRDHSKTWKGLQRHKDLRKLKMKLADWCQHYFDHAKKSTKIN